MDVHDLDVHDKLDELMAVVEGARAVPMSGSCIVSRSELLALLDDVRELLPEELRHAELLLHDREAVVEEGRREAARVVAAAEAERDRLLDEAAVVQEARARAEEIVADAEERAARLRRDADDYVDARLEDFELQLHRLLAGVHRGREKLHARGDGAAAHRAPSDQESAG